MNPHAVNGSQDGFDELLRYVSDDMEQKLAKGETPVLADYQERFPAHSSSDVEQVFLGVKALLALRTASSSLKFPRFGGISGGVLGDFHVGAEIARGGMGIVYRARQISLQRAVALKLLPFVNLLDPSMLHRFRREVQTAASLEHENIVPIWAVGEDRGMHYYAMRLIEGPTWAQLIGDQATQLSRGAEQKNFDKSPTSRLLRLRVSNPSQYFKEIAGFGSQAAAGLAYAHEQGVVHRDIKPSNLLVDDNNHVWVTDFGLALVEGNHTATKLGELLGTPRYMSPEQVECKPDLVDYRTDIYSLGAALYELSTSRPLFDSSNTSQLFNLIVNKDPVLPRSAAPDLPIDLQVIILKCLEKDAVARYRTAQELKDDLDRFVSGEPIHAKPSGRFKRALALANRNPTATRAVAIGSFAFIVALGLLGLVLWRAKNAARRTSEATQELLRLNTARISEAEAGWREAHQQVISSIADRLELAAVKEATTATMVGFDAKLIYHNPDIAPSQISFDTSGSKIAFNETARNGVTTSHPGTLDLSSESVIFVEDGVMGDVGYGPNAQPIVFNWDANGNARLCSIAKEENERIFELPKGLSPAKLRPSISADSTRLAGIAERDGTSVLLVWELAAESTPDEVDLPRTESVPESLALSPNGDLAAVGFSNGVVHVANWSRNEVVTLKANSSVTSLAIGFNPLLPADGGLGAFDSSLLAVGEGTGLVSVWDLQKRAVQSFCRGGNYAVRAIDFSTDATMLIFASRFGVRLHRVDNGAQVLNLRAGNVICDATFSRDRNKIAVASAPVFEGGGLYVFELSNGEGITTLHGLSSPIMKIANSIDGSTLAALSQDWKIAVWNTNSGTLRRIVQAPPGLSDGNAGLAISPNGDRIAFTAGRDGVVWQVDSGRMLSSFGLYAGRCDVLAFSDDGLISLRLETNEPSQMPNPRGDNVCRIRNLLDVDGPKIILESDAFSGDMRSARIDAKGEYMVVSGWQDASERHLVVFNSGGTFIGRVLPKSDRLGPLEFSRVAMSPNGRFFAIQARYENFSRLYEIANDEIHFLAKTSEPLSELGPSLEYVATGRDTQWKISTGIQGLEQVTIDFNARLSTAGLFASDGASFVCGANDGRVFVCDLVELIAND